MKFKYRKVPEGINVTQVHPLRELAVLVLGAALLITLLVYLLGLSAGYLARYIPFDMELKLANAFVQEAEEPNPVLTDYLEALKTRVTEAMELPEEMTVRLHYARGDTVNAFATLGGNVVLYRGLLKKLPNENALVMLLAHEIAHVKHRDPITSVARGLTVGTALSLLIGQNDLDVLGQTGLYTLLHFSREMERDADRVALEVVNRLYGHTNGADDLFHILQTYHQESGETEGLEFLQSHPLDRKRIDEIDNQTRLKQWSGQGEPSPIPAAFFDALAESE